ncbi:MAG: TetR/AcrR family transcriptional regulator [Gordonia sp. (in: high G+C Gram-positive bacteria)]|uniref:TetR/AcrR family transcriptional regulator n=1 Tax=Gordonia TaxID=2053 RepID=UPI0032631284
MSVPAADWMRGTRREAVQERILQIAGEVFAAEGPDASMAELAAAVGCSRATLYRYFDGRRQLQLAYVERVARRIGRTVDAAVAGIVDPQERLTEAVLGALALVRDDPALAVWFVPRGAGVAGELALSSEVIGAAAAAFLRPDSDGEGGAEDTGAAARWLVRVIVSLLAVPGETTRDERDMIARFVAPGVVAATT